MFSKSDYNKSFDQLTSTQLHNVISKSVMSKISENWIKSKENHQKTRCAYYFSAEFLVGRAIYNNLLSLGLTEEVEKQLAALNMSLNMLEEVEDAALGNGGLGRLAACFLESAATQNFPLDGYGIRYKYGLFSQKIECGFQKEYVDDWTKNGDPWSIRCDEEAVTVDFKGLSVKAVPYDMPIIGYRTSNIGTLRLWQCEPSQAFNFDDFNDQIYDKALKDKNAAENISRVLYPNDNKRQGKILRFKQQYFFSSASLQDIIKSYKKNHGENFDEFASFVTIQLNDTHPVISIPEFIRLMIKNENMPFQKAFELSKKVFNYTNHTIMQEALEKWEMSLIKSLTPEVASIIVKINKCLKSDLQQKGIDEKTLNEMLIIQGNTVNMAYLATYVCAYVNGVAQIHTDILKKDTLFNWYCYYPDKFQNKTNGITQRRFLALCNRELSDFITSLLGSEAWITDLKQLKQLEKYANDDVVLEEFIKIKNIKKQQLANYIDGKEKISIDENTMFDVQIKRLHEYKRQLLNILCILEIFFEIKGGKLKDFTPTTFIFGAKSAPGYERAKGIIKLISEVSRLIDNDNDARKFIKVVFIQNYNVSYAEKIVAAANVSEQISTAGTEASGTGNMKLMLNGAVTLGTYDGANIEIVQEAGKENNYIFGARVEEIEKIKESYSPRGIYEKNGKIKRVLDALIDGTLDDGDTGIFKELYSSILDGTAWHDADQYYLLLDFDNYLETRLRLSDDYKNQKEFAKKSWINMCNAGKFSSDRTIKQYAEEIWNI
ncbi:MAG: glycogen/starch/alpha-glucan phosphorylase [Oscillospiraceae bacterium]